MYSTLLQSLVGYRHLDLSLVMEAVLYRTSLLCWKVVADVGEEPAGVVGVVSHEPDPVELALYEVHDGC